MTRQQTGPPSADEAWRGGARPTGSRAPRRVLVVRAATVRCACCVLGTAAASSGARARRAAKPKPYRQALAVDVCALVASARALPRLLSERVRRIVVEGALGAGLAVPRKNASRRFAKRVPPSQDSALAGALRVGSSRSARLLHFCEPSVRVRNARHGFRSIVSRPRGTAARSRLFSRF